MISDFQANFTAIIETSSRSRIDRCPKNSACLRLRVIACQLACLDEGAACFVSKAQSRSCAWQCWLVPLWCWASCVLVSVTRCDRHFPEPSAVGATCWPRRVVYHSRLRVYEPLFARAQCSKVVGASATMVGDPLAALHRLPRYPHTQVHWQPRLHRFRTAHTRGVDIRVLSFPSGRGGAARVS